MYLFHKLLHVDRCYEVTLKDFRSAIGKSSSHKFFFKSQDPDIGQVKEEVCLFVSLYLILPILDHIVGIRQWCHSPKL